MTLTFTINLWYILYTITAFFALYFSFSIFLILKFIVSSSKDLGFLVTMKNARADWRIFVYLFFFPLEDFRR